MTWPRELMGLRGLTREQKVCPFCNSTAEPTHTVVEAGRIVWCTRHKVLLVSDLEFRRTCDVPGCGERAEFAEMDCYPHQYSCRTHLGLASRGPMNVVGLTERAITAVNAWQQEHLAKFRALLKERS